MKKHLVFTLGRSGSNYIVSILNAHPEITNYGEVLGEWNLSYKLHKKIGFGGNSLLTYFNYIYNSKSFFYLAQIYDVFSDLKNHQKIHFKFWHNIKTIGVKDFSINFKLNKLLDFLQENNEILIINLYRENQLKRFLSFKKMWHERIVKITTEKIPEKLMIKRNKKLYLEPVELIKKLHIYQTEIENHQAFIKKISPERVLNISYEKFFASSESKNYYLNEMWDFLGVTPIPVESSHRKILSDNISDIIENYEEVYRELKKTEFAKYLDS